MGAAHHARPGRDCRANDLVDPEHLERPRRPDDVDDRVVPADLVEVHLVDRTTVQRRLNGGQRVERGQGSLRDPVGQGRLGDERGNGAVCPDNHVVPADDGACAGDAAAQRVLESQVPPRQIEPAEQASHLVRVGSCVDQGAERHVAGDAGKAVEPGDRRAGGLRHGSSRAIAQAAPYPLSIPTTVMPDEQADSMVNNAVTPSSAAPYPVLVGTATTGAGVSPPTTLASAPSMPAITTTASAMAMVSASARRRCRPATPQSVSLVGSNPSARRTASHSVAIGRSAVPAVSTTTEPGRSDAGRNTTVEKVPLSAMAPGPAPLAVGDGRGRLDLGLAGSGEEHRPAAAIEQLLDHRGAVFRGLARSVDGLGYAEAQVALEVHAGEAEVRVGQPAQLTHCVVGRAGARSDLFDQQTKGRSVHDLLYPAQP